MFTRKMSNRQGIASIVSDTSSEPYCLEKTPEPASYHQHAIKKSANIAREDYFQMSSPPKERKTLETSLPIVQSAWKNASMFQSSQDTSINHIPIDQNRYLWQD